MRPTEVSDDQIIEAGVQLENENTRVTGFALRRLIGAGTPARLFKVWSNHKDGTAPIPTTESESPPLPGEIEPALKAATEQITNSLRQLVIGLHGHCQREAQQKVTKAQQDADAKCALYLEELADASGQIESAEQQSMAHEKHSQALSQELAAANERISRLVAELTLVKDRLERGDTELHEAREAASIARQEAGEATARATAAEQALAETKQAHAEDQGRNQEALAGELEKRKAVENRLAQVQITCDALSEQINSKNNHLASANTQIKGLENQLVERGLRLEEQRSEMSSKRQSITHLERQVEALMVENMKLRGDEETQPGRAS